MSILNVEHLTHGFGDRAIFNDVSFRLLKGEHIGLVGAIYEYRDRKAYAGRGKSGMGEKRPCRLSRPALHTDQRHDNRECVKIGVRMAV